MKGVSGWQRAAAALVAAGALVGPAPSRAEDEPVTLEQALAAAQGRQEFVAAGLRTWLSWPGQELRLPDMAHLPAAAAARLHVRWRFYEVLLADQRGDALAERLAMAFNQAERAGAAGSGVPREQRDRLDIGYLELRAQRDRNNGVRREARALLSAAMGEPGRAIAEARLPVPLARGLHAEPPADRIERAARALGATPAADQLRLRLLRAWLELEQAQGSARAAAARRLQAAEARIDEARARLDSEARGTEFGLAEAAGVDARADVLRVELQVELLAAWLEESLGAPLGPAR